MIKNGTVSVALKLNNNKNHSPADDAEVGRLSQVTLATVMRHRPCRT